MTETPARYYTRRHFDGNGNNSPATIHKGNIHHIRRFIPSFDRMPFGLTQPVQGRSRINNRLETIVRLPIGEDDELVPVGVVSKDYVLLQHTAVVDAAQEAIEGAGIEIAEVTAHLRITEFGERIALSLILPSKFNFDPGDGNAMALRLECFNSVDCSTRFRVVVGWFRLVCSNGLMVGMTRSDIRRRHVGDFQIDDVGTVLMAGLTQAEIEKTVLRKWMKIPVKIDQIGAWVSRTVRDAWGFKAATRAYHIARSGSDVKIAGQYKSQSPTTIAVQELKPVPGSQKGCTNLFDVSQVLAWLAKERKDVQEQIEWREQIPKLLESLNG
jgi:hypothetical protein